MSLSDNYNRVVGELFNQSPLIYIGIIFILAIILVMFNIHPMMSRIFKFLILFILIAYLTKMPIISFFVALFLIIVIDRRAAQPVQPIIIERNTPDLVNDTGYEFVESDADHASFYGNGLVDLEREMKPDPFKPQNFYPQTVSDDMSVYESRSNDYDVLPYDEMSFAQF